MKDSTDDEWIDMLRPQIPRVARALVFGVCAFLLLLANTYPLGGFMSLVLSIALLAGFHVTSKIARMALIALVAMALVPYPAIIALAEALS